VPADRESSTTLEYTTNADTTGPTLAWSCDVRLSAGDFAALDSKQISGLLDAITTIASIVDRIRRTRDEAQTSTEGAERP
jgi:hypothetical protein